MSPEVRTALEDAITSLEDIALAGGPNETRLKACAAIIRLALDEEK